jgi:uncharacterized Tic20 family protein
MPGGPEPTAGEVPPAGPNQEARTWAMAAHLAGLVSFIGPLIVWIIKKDEFPFVDDQGKEALNFQISMCIYMIVASLLIFAFIGCILLPVVGILDIVFLIVAAVRANSGEAYRYPIAIRFIR